MPSRQTTINVPRTSTRPPSPTPSDQNLSITPTTPSPSLSPEHPLSPEPALSPPPAPPDLSTEDVPNQSINLMNDTIDYYKIEPAAAEPSPRAPQVETTPIQCYD